MKKINRHGIVAAKISYNNSYKENLEYFCIEALEDGLQAKLSVNACEYSLDGNTWNSLSAATNTPDVNTGEKIYFRGNLTPKIIEGIGTFTISKKCNLKGNIMSLLYGDDFEGQNDLTGKNYAFYKLFYNCKTIVDVSELLLPATTLESNCYYSMFEDCTSLTSAPELPATTLADSCYVSMFEGCRSLTVAPELPATSLSKWCYKSMFNGSGLTTAPVLPATTLAGSCYDYMFRSCNSLTTAPELPATTLAYGCYSYMFENCTRLTAAPELPATKLASRCYEYMFSGTNVLPDCSNIDFTSELVVSSGGLIGLFSGTKVTDVDLERILPKNNEGKYYLPVTTLASDCYSYMFEGCKSLTTAPELPATTLAEDCYYHMFYYCNSLTTAPVLPATTLENGCYYCMFHGCSKLNYIKMLATDISASRCFDYWVYGVASNGTFVKHKDMTSLPSGTSGIPNGWTVEDYVENNLITFTIDGVEYQAEEGMTWADWYVSNYNSGILGENMNPSKDSIYENLDESVMIAVGEFYDEYGNSVYFGDVIIKNHTYKPRNTPPPL